MKKSKLLIILLVFTMVFTIALAGCNGGEDANEKENPDKVANEGEKTEDESSENSEEEKLAAEQVLKVNWTSEPPNLDPQLTQDHTSSNILNDSFEGIIRMDEDGVPEEGSGMAESWDIEDDTKYTFHLRDAKWSDGEPVTAHDFEFAWKRALDPATGSTYAFLAYGIKNGEAYNTGKIDNVDEVGVKALDEKTLEVILERPDPTFLSKLQNSTFLPTRKDKIEEWGEKYGSEIEYMVFNGPFVITEWEHESQLNMERNPNYWNAENVKLERIEGVMVNDSNTSMNLYETGELDIVDVPSQYLEQYKDKLNTYPEASTFYYTFNVENEFFKNQNIRKAFGMAIDRKKIQEVRTQGIVPPAWGFVPPGMPGPEGKSFREANGELIKDVGNGSSAEEAKELLEKGLEEIGKEAEDMNGIKFLTFDNDNALQRAQIWQQYWKETLGVDVELEQATFKIKIERENKGDFAFSYSGWIGDYNDPMTFMDMWVTGGSQNTTGWSNDKYDKLIKKAQTTSGPERMEAMLEAEKILMDEMPLSPTDHSVHIVLENPKIRGIVRLPLQMTDGLYEAYLVE